MKEKILIKLNEIIKNRLPESLKNVEIEPHLSLWDDLMVNSILFYSLLMDIENTFDIQLKIVTMEADEYRTVGELADYITHLLEEHSRNVV